MGEVGFTLDSSFDEANYGCRSCRDFLQRNGHRVRTAGRSGYDITLTLIDHEPDSPAASGL